MQGEQLAQKIPEKAPFDISLRMQGKRRWTSPFSVFWCDISLRTQGKRTTMTDIVEEAVDISLRAQG